MKLRHLTAAAALAVGLATSAMAVEPVQQHNSNAVWFENWIGLSNGSMRVASPDGRMTDVYAENGTPVFELKGDIADGVYRYELRAQTEEMVKNHDYNEELAEVLGSKEYMPKPFYTTGRFIVERGVIITPEEIEEEKD